MFKRKVKKYIHEKQRAELLEDSKQYKKLDHQKMASEPFERKKFFYELNLENARMRYKLHNDLVPSVRTHFSRKYRNTALTCPACARGLEDRPSQAPVTPPHTPGDRGSSDRNFTLPSDTTTHILMHCEEYKDPQGENFDPEDDTLLAQFFRRVVERRLEKGDI